MIYRNDTVIALQKNPVHLVVLSNTFLKNNKMSHLVLIGAQWGDEGKGKIIDHLAKDFDVVARYQGGHNAGHTVKIGDKTRFLHFIPSGIFRPDKICILGNGMVIDPGELIKEIDTIKADGIDVAGRILVSSNAHLIMPYHYLLDSSKEQDLGEKNIGTTKRGIGPAYADKMRRIGIRICDLYEKERLRSLIEENLKEKRLTLKELYGLDCPEAEKIEKEYLAYGEKIEPFVTDTTLAVRKYYEEGKKFLVEGAQGSMLDIDHGTYPFVTSSSPCIGGVGTGLGISPGKIKKVLGIAKAYCTRVGSGPFPTELFDKLGDQIREQGQEFGTTTGRPRRCGWLDIVALRHAIWVNGFTSLAITKLDVLDDLDSLNICVRYENNGNTIEDFPTNLSLLENCKPVYETLPGWKTNISRIKNYEQLPSSTKNYLGKIETLAGTPISLVSVGAERGETLVK